MSKAKAEELGLTWLAEIGAHGMVAGPDSTLQQQPARAIARGLREGGHHARRPRPRRDQRGVRRRRPRLRQGARHRRRQGQRQRRRHRPRPPDRHVRRPHRPAPRARAEAPRRRRRRGRALRRRRPGRRPHRPRARGLTSPDPAPVARRSVDVPALVESARAGSPRAVARLISLVEDGHASLREVMAALAPHAGNAHVIGLTGSPGRRQVDDDDRARRRLPRARAAGRRARGRPVARPSPGGALLGDRVRMQDHALDPEVYIRSMAVARTPRRPVLSRRRRPSACSTRPGATSCSSRPSAWASPRSRSPASPTPPSCCSRPGMGDGIQAAKAGILEIGDVFVVNKADRDGADATVRDLRHMISLGDRTEPGPVAAAGRQDRRGAEGRDRRGDGGARQAPGLHRGERRAAPVAASAAPPTRSRRSR